MTSKTSSKTSRVVDECFIYIQLPQSLEVVTCGRFRQRAGVGSFVYGKSYCDNPNAVPLDPFELPLRDGTTFETARLGGIFGALRDAGPDAWGRRIIEKQLARADASEIDFLLNSPEDRAGALSFGLNVAPPAPTRHFNRVLQLAVLLTEAERFSEEGRLSPQVADLIQPGTSMGGARPKNVVEDDDGLWLAKFPDKGDRWNNAAVEAAMLGLAMLCGIRSAEYRLVRVLEKDVLLVKRFDRERGDDGYLRHRMVSALTVLQADEVVSQRERWSYLLLADELRRWVRDPAADGLELFRRIVFNALISNTDDHPRNHALIAPSRQWQLAPAYDLTPNPLYSADARDLAMSLGTLHRRASRENLLSSCERFNVSRDRANQIIDEMKAVVAARWRECVSANGGNARDCAEIERAFVYEGFELVGERGR